MHGESCHDWCGTARWPMAKLLDRHKARSLSCRFQAPFSRSSLLHPSSQITARQCRPEFMRDMMGSPPGLSLLQERLEEAGNKIPKLIRRFVGMAMRAVHAGVAEVFDGADGIWEQDLPLLLAEPTIHVVLQAHSCFGPDVRLVAPVGFRRVSGGQGQPGQAMQSAMKTSGKQQAKGGNRASPDPTSRRFAACGQTVDNRREDQTGDPRGEPEQQMNTRGAWG